MAARKKIIEAGDATDPQIETSDVEDASRATYFVTRSIVSAQLRDRVGNLTSDHPRAVVDLACH
jgi:hypothetical protein